MGTRRSQNPPNLHELAANLGALAQAIEHQAAAVAALVEEIAAVSTQEPQQDESASPVPLGGKGRIHGR